jgi:hypothetical protein
MATAATSNKFCHRRPHRLDGSKSSIIPDYLVPLDVEDREPMASRRSNLAARTQNDERPAPPNKRASRVVLADEADHAPRFSPARALQARLTDATSAPDPDRWSPRATLLFVVGVCGAFWAAMGGAVMVVLH